MNAILVDALWELAEKEGLSRAKIQALLPANVKQEPQAQTKITEIPTLRRREATEKLKAATEGSQGGKGP